MALTNRESLVRALQISGSASIKAKGIQNIPTQGGSALTGLFFQQQALTSVDLENVLGTSDEFLKRMSQWQAKVESAMATQLRVKGNQFTNINLLKRRLSVNLNMFNKKTADELYSSYYNDVLRMPALLRKAGAPAVELPSGNLYTSAFKFMVDQSGTYHPGREVLTSMIMNFNPSRSPLDALSISRSNILSYKTLERMTKEAGQRKLPTDVFGTLKAGQKVLTFDIETTGVFEGAQMRSAAAAEMVIGKGGVIKSPVVNEQMFLASNQLSGLTVKDSNGAVETMTR